MTYPYPFLFKEKNHLRNSNVKLINILDAAIKNTIPTSINSERPKQGGSSTNISKANNNDDNILLYLKRTKNQIDIKTDDGKRLKEFLSKLEKRVSAYQAVLSKKSHSQYELTQYHRFVILLKTCLKKEVSSELFEAEINTYFNPRDYLTIAHTVKNNEYDTFNPVDDSIQNNSTQILAAVGLGLSIMALGAAAITFCPFLTPIAISVGLLITVCAILSLLAPKQPNNEKITTEEKELFKAAYQFAHSEPENDELTLRTRGCLSIKND